MERPGHTVRLVAPGRHAGHLTGTLRGRSASIAGVEGSGGYSRFRRVRADAGDDGRFDAKRHGWYVRVRDVRHASMAGSGAGEQGERGASRGGGRAWARLRVHDPVAAQKIGVEGRVVREAGGVARQARRRRHRPRRVRHRREDVRRWQAHRLGRG